MEHNPYMRSISEEQSVRQHNPPLKLMSSCSKPWALEIHDLDHDICSLSHTVQATHSLQAPRQLSLPMGMVWGSVQTPTRIPYYNESPKNFIFHTSESQLLSREVLSPHGGRPVRFCFAVA